MAHMLVLASKHTCEGIFDHELALSRYLNFGVYALAISRSGARQLDSWQQDLYPLRQRLSEPSSGINVAG